MSQTIITKAFETYKAEKEAVLQSVQLDEFVLANVPGLDPTQPIDRNETVPTKYIVHVSDVHQDGFVNPNAVVYSITLDTRLGDFDFNWIGLRNKASGVLAAITHLAPISKYKSIPGVQNGNAITRSMLMSYLGAKSATGISVDASTWQIDFTARLFGIDEAERLANRDHYDGATFFSSGFLVYKEGASYKVTAGLGYVEGLRTLLNGDHILTVPSGQHYVYVDSSWQGQVTSRWHSVVTFQVSTTELTHYTDEHGFIHYLAKIATIQSNGNVIDHRIVKAEFERKDNAATNADIDNKSTTAKHIKLPQFWRAFLGFLTNDWNGSRTDVGVSQKGVTDGLATKIDKTSITDSTSSTSSVLVASAKAIKTVKDIANAKWTYVTATTARYGATLLSNSYSGSSQTKAVTELALKNGLATKTNTNHAHDDDYYLKSQTDSLLAGKLSSSAKATLTDNDGHGNANVTFNHKGGVPQQNGSSARIETSVDSNVASMVIELGDTVIKGVAKTLTGVITLTTSSIALMKNTTVSGWLNASVLKEGNISLIDKYLGKTATAADSEKLKGYGLTDAATGNTVARRNSSGDLLARLFRSNYGNSSSISGALAFRVNNSSDNYIRFCSNINAIKNWLVAASKPDYRYTVANVTLTRKAEHTVIQRWGTQNATISIDVSTFQVGDIITIVNVRKDSGVVTITNLDGTIYVFNGSSAGTHTFTGMGQISFIKNSSGNNLMQMTR